MPANEYQELTAAEVAGRLHCTTAVVHSLENKGELIAILAPAPINERRYPAFQLHERLDRHSLTKTIQEFRRARVSTNQLWGFLRTAQKDFGETAVDILLGASSPCFGRLVGE